LSKKYEFLCAKSFDNTRTWWSQHSTELETPLLSAYCEYPCSLKRPCTSPGGILLDGESPIRESVAEANFVTNSCNLVPGPSIPSGNTDDNLFVKPDNGKECTNATDQEMVPNELSCNVFHVCLNGQRKDFRCARASNRPYDLWWNNETKRCDWPCNVKCDKGIYDDTKINSEILELDKDNCVAPSHHSTVLPGYGRK